MDTGLDLTTASREALLALIAQQQAVITELQRRLDLLEGKAKPGGSPRMPGIKPKSGQGPAKDKRLSNRAVDEWLSLFDDPILGNSALDRLANASYQIVIEGSSYRERLSPHRALLESKGVIDQPPAT